MTTLRQRIGIDSNLARVVTILMTDSVLRSAHLPRVVVTPLLLAGGHSSRFGSPKHHAIWTDGRPLYTHMLELIKEACSDASDIFVSLRDPSNINEKITWGERFQLIYDTTRDSDENDIGPAAGLLAAHAARPDAHWLIVACDYPLISTATLMQLRDEYQEPLTCFQNIDGFPEPLLAIWSPLALRHLVENVGKGILGPSKALRDLQGKTIVPANELWLRNTNTQAEFQEAISLSRNMND